MDRRTNGQTSVTGRNQEFYQGLFLFVGEILSDRKCRLLKKMDA